MDWVLGLPETSDGNTCMWVAIDMYTGFTMAKAAKNTTSDITVNFFLDAIMFKFGIPRCVHTDNGTHFMKTFDALCKRWHIIHSFSVPYYPQSHGRVEQSNRLILDRLRRKQNPNWDRALSSTIYSINSRNSTSHPHSGLVRDPAAWAR